MDACSKLDSRNLLTSTESVLTEAEKRKRRNEIFGDTEGDDDNFYDRTSGSSKKKTLAGQRKERPAVETLSTLTQKRDATRKELEALNAAISKLEEENTTGPAKDDELDSFMSEMQSAAQKKDLKEKRARIPILEKVHWCIPCRLFLDTH